MDGTFQSGQVIHTACLTAGSSTKNCSYGSSGRKKKERKRLRNGGRAGTKENACFEILVASLYNATLLYHFYNSLMVSKEPISSGIRAAGNSVK
mmetsp:Transcript_27235/g.49235  ORF Transcript_27235/g.49235 Transcript_27235/m.49235 type:complete len:94 (+) Transcript_27235:1571-1852(+)